jgi:hypothetical protein
MKRLQQITGLIKEKRIPVASKDLMRAGKFVERMNECYGTYILKISKASPERICLFWQV